MNSLTEKISVKDFNNFFENDQTSKAFSRLAERKLKKFHRPKYYKYNKEELIEISKFPLSKLTKDEFYARIQSNQNLDEKIIQSLQKKERDPSDENSDQSDSDPKFYPQKMHNQDNYHHQSDNYHQSLNKSDRNYKSSGGKYSHEQDSNQNWRSDRLNLGYRSGPNGINSNIKRGGSSKDYHHRKNGPLKYSFRERRDNNYVRGDDFKYSNEREPEWFAEGPKSINDFIDLKGFDDDYENEHAHRNDRVDKNEEEDDQDDRNDPNRINARVSNSGDDFQEKDSSGKSKVLQKNIFDKKFGFSFSDVSNDDFSSILDSADVSLLENIENSLVFGNTSRSEKWFKNRINNDEKNPNNANNNNSKNNSINDNNNILFNLFQKQNIDISNLFHPTESKLSQAIDVSELEASMLNESSTIVSPKRRNPSASSSTSSKPFDQNEFDERQQQQQNQLSLFFSKLGFSVQKEEQKADAPVRYDSISNQEMSMIGDEKNSEHDSSKSSSNPINLSQSSALSEMDFLQKMLRAQRRDDLSLPQNSPTNSSGIIINNNMDILQQLDEFKMANNLKQTGSIPVSRDSPPPLQINAQNTQCSKPQQVMAQTIPSIRFMNRPIMNRLPFVMQADMNPFVFNNAALQGIPHLIPPSTHAAYRAQFPPTNFPIQNMICNPMLYNAYINTQSSMMPLAPQFVHRPPFTMPQSLNTNVEVKSSTDNSMASKLLKNSKFTPTSVFRKLKDHDPTKQTSKSILQVRSSSESPHQSSETNRHTSTPITINQNNAEDHNVADLFKKLQISISDSKSNLDETNPIKLPQNPEESIFSQQQHQSHHIKVVNPNDIFSFFKANSHLMPASVPSASQSASSSSMQNALTVNDIEKL
ncbi:synaptogyrin-2 [Sarcoptes scabiei]|nr:synaptogyrin-2 [Sarcoptes scabiei]